MIVLFTFGHLLILSCIAFANDQIKEVEKSSRTSIYNKVLRSSQYLGTCETKTDKGICMYQWDCWHSGGKPIGLCQHGFQFGACCMHDASNNEIKSQATSTNHSLEIKEKVISHHTKHLCGISSVQKRSYGRIVGGRRAKIGEVPWQVSVLVYRGFIEGFTHQCGGAILNEKWVVTAAHCVARNLIVEMKVRVGENDFKNQNEKYPHRDFKIKRQIIHPAYKIGAAEFESDIALLELKDKIKFRRHVLPICLPGPDLKIEGKVPTVTGWGRTKHEGNWSNTLQIVSLPVITNSQCEELYAQSGIPQNIPNILLCAGLPSGGRDACTGDSGGPLQLKLEDDRVVLIGIVSWGNGCGDPLKPGAYTRVSEFVNWILSHILQK